MEPENAPAQPPAEKTPEDKAAAAENAGAEAVAQAAQVEAEAVAQAAAAHKEAERIAEAAGERAAQKWLDSKLKEIEDAGNKRIEELRTWLDGRITEIQGKKPAEKAAAEGAGTPQPAPETREPVRSGEGRQRKFRII